MVETIKLADAQGSWTLTSEHASKQAYDRWATVYDLVWRRAFLQSRKELLVRRKCCL